MSQDKRVDRAPPRLFYGERGAAPTAQGDYYYLDSDKAGAEEVVVRVQTMGAALVVRFASGAYQPVTSMTGRFAGPIPRPERRR